MASLLFNISSKFDSSGFKAAQSSFKRTIGGALKLAGVLASVAFAGKTLGIAAGIFAVVSLKKLTGSFFKTNQEAISAEISFVRLKTQLRLVGEESEKSAALITRGAEQTARTSRFSVLEVQRATTIALQSTRDLAKAQQTVNVARDVAAATGRDLVTTTRILNLAQKGNIRILLQLTDLRRADIKQAIRQGTLLDKLAEKFGGAAKDEAGTLASKLQTLANVQDELTKEIGKTGLGFNKFTTNVRILLNVVGLKLARALKEGRGQIEVFSFALAKQFAFQIFDKSIDTTIGKVFDFNKALELNVLRLGKTSEERRQLSRNTARAEAILLQAQLSGIDTLTAEQLEFGNFFKFFQEGIRDELRATTEAQEDANKAANKRTAELKSKQKGFGILGTLQDSKKVFDDLVQGGLSVSDALSEAARSSGLLNETQKEQNRLLKEADQSQGFDPDVLNNFSIKTQQADDDAQELIKTLKTLGGLTGEAVSGLGKAVNVALNPLSQVTVILGVTEEQIKASVKDAAREILKSVISGFQRTATNAARESSAQETFG